MLSQPLHAEAGRLQFRPMLPLRGAEQGGFLCRTLLVPPQAGTGLRIAPEVHTLVAASMGAQSVVDRLSFDLVARYARSALVAANGWRVLLPVASVTLQEPLVGEWLQLSGVDPGQLLLAVDSRDLSPGSSLAAALQRLAGRGWHWALRADAPQAIEKGALQLPNLDVLLLGTPPAHPGAWDAVLKLARDFGKIVVATGVDETRQVAPLFAAGVHYAIGDAAGGWEDEPRFEMTHVR
jgi:EAL domain-containing protein (putative c-di-GMP-specific phosphodiesterase class I)